MLPLFGVGSYSEVLQIQGPLCSLLGAWTYSEVLLRPACSKAQPQSRAYTTVCRPVLVCRPKCNTVDLTDRNLISLDSRAKPPKVSPSLATQQEQITPSAAAISEQPKLSPPLLQKPQSSPPLPIHQTLCAPKNTSSILESASAMANFPVNPQAFLVAGL